MAGILTRLSNFAAIAGVYTPPELRGRGYAGSVTAAIGSADFGSEAAAVLIRDMRRSSGTQPTAKIQSASARLRSGFGYDQVHWNVERPRVDRLQQLKREPDADGERAWFQRLRACDRIAAIAEPITGAVEANKWCQNRRRQHDVALSGTGISHTPWTRLSPGRHRRYSSGPRRSTTTGNRPAATRLSTSGRGSKFGTKRPIDAEYSGALLEQRSQADHDPLTPVLSDRRRQPDAPGQQTRALLLSPSLDLGRVHDAFPRMIIRTARSRRRPRERCSLRRRVAAVLRAGIHEAARAPSLYRNGARTAGLLTPKCGLQMRPAGWAARKCLCHRQWTRRRHADNTSCAGGEFKGGSWSAASFTSF